MRNSFSIGMVLGLALVGGTAKAQRVVEPFDAGWRFLQADAAGAEAVGFSDAGWAAVTLPHDWAIAGPFDPKNPSGGAGAFAPAGVGWYRKVFDAPAGFAGRRVFVEFDGVMQNSDVWINGTLLGHRPSGYVSLRYELTGKLKPVGNVLAVRADDAKQPASRFYEGAGIYRHVRLVVTAPVHTTTHATFVHADKVSAAGADVHVETVVRNDSAYAAKVLVQAAVVDPAGKVVATVASKSETLAPGEEKPFVVSKSVMKPEPWGVGHGVMYSVKLSVVSDGKTVDDERVAFGIRDAHWESATGFWLNGKNIKIKGVALHSDVGSLGMAAPLGAWEHRLNAMRAMGANAIRTAHNAVAPEFLELCDRMGLLVMDEFFDQWTVAKNPYDYHLYFKEWFLKDTHDTVLRDRNHPSVVIYSAGNEIHDTPKPEIAIPILKALVEEYHRDDPTRPVTQALFRPNVSHDYEDGLADLLDVVGQNYRPLEVLAAYKQKPTRKMLGTENIHDLDSWQKMRDHPEYSGEFIWSGTDYLGESRHWPIIGDASGLYDRTDAPKGDGLERQAWWAERPVVYLVRRTSPTPLAPTDPGYEAEQYRPKQVLFADWSPKNRGAHDESVEVYSNCDEVEVWLNGKSLGVQKKNADDSARKWVVPFAAGELKAVGRDGGKVAATDVLKTAGKPAALKLVVEQAVKPGWDGVGYVRAFVVDEAGTLVPDASSLLRFRVVGKGTLLTTDSGDNADNSGFQRPDRVAFHGTAIAIVRGESGMRVRVESDGLRADEVVVK